MFNISLLAESNIEISFVEKPASRSRSTIRCACSWVLVTHTNAGSTFLTSIRLSSFHFAILATGTFRDIQPRHGVAPLGTNVITCCTALRLGEVTSGSIEQVEMLCLGGLGIAKALRSAIVVVRARLPDELRVHGIAFVGFTLASRVFEILLRRLDRWKRDLGLRRC